MEEVHKTARRDSVIQKSDDGPHPAQEQKPPVAKAAHVAVTAIAAADAAADQSTEDEITALGESIAMIDKTPQEIPWYEQPAGPTAAEVLMQKRRCSVTRAPIAPSPLRTATTLHY